jgi:hypothetical protein
VAAEKQVQDHRPTSDSFLDIEFSIAPPLFITKSTIETFSSNERLLNLVMSMSQDAANLAVLLFALTQPDTEAIRNAEATLKPILKNPNCIPALFEVLSSRGTQVCSIVGTTSAFS